MYDIAAILALFLTFFLLVLGAFTAVGYIMDDEQELVCMEKVAHVKAKRNGLVITYPYKIQGNTVLCNQESLR